MQKWFFLERLGKRKRSCIAYWCHKITIAFGIWNIFFYPQQIDAVHQNFFLPFFVDKGQPCIQMYTLTINESLAFKFHMFWFRLCTMGFVLHLQVCFRKRLQCFSLFSNFAIICNIIHDRTFVIIHTMASFIAFPCIALFLYCLQYTPV